ncbi:MAG: tripartite tricarboxylate transporter substrate binding protein [Proteobacteria bacterium]|nr:tripartite tricarboxylate transporter substrate binding protein [Pseudomonadota bacterium]
MMGGRTMTGTGSPLRRLFCAALLALLTAAGFATGIDTAQAKYPERPLRIIVPFGAGGVADITTRLVGEKLGDKLGQRVVVENVPGAGGIAAARAALAGGADGYTLILVTNGTAISVPLFKSLPFDPLKDFVPISSMGFFDCVFVTNSEAQFRTLAEFMAAARAKPGGLNVGTINVGSTQNLSAELFKAVTGLDFVIVPFRSTPEATIALLRNDVQMVIDFPAALKAGLADKKLRAIAATGPVSAKILDGVPTVSQAGVADYEVTSWNSIWAPAGTPKDIVETLNAALRAVLDDPDIKSRALPLGIEARASSPAEIEARMRADIDKWAKVIERANIRRR